MDELILKHYEELYHHGVKGMRWGIRKDRHKSNKRVSTENELRILSKKGESVELHQSPKSSTAKLLARFIPSIQEKQDKFRDYSIKSKNGTTVGNISTNLDSATTMNIVWLGVPEKYSGKGYGQSAMRTLIDDAKNQGIRKMTLEVPTISPNARHIYEKLGFKETGEKMLGNKNDVWGGLTKMELDLKK